MCTLNPAALAPKGLQVGIPSLALGSILSLFVSVGFFGRGISPCFKIRVCLQYIIIIFILETGAHTNCILIFFTFSSVCEIGCHYVTQADSESMGISDLPASASQVARTIAMCHHLLFKLFKPMICRPLAAQGGDP